jgi:hypothetical protein
VRSGTPRTLLAVAAAVLLIVWQLDQASKAHALFGDFRAFYCAASVLTHGGSPYAASAMYACESEPMPWGLYSAANGVAVPAPLPGYAVIAFVPFSVFAYQGACIAWLLVVLASTALAVCALSLLLDRPVAGALAALAPGIAIVVVPFGELGCIVLAALLCMGLALRARAWGWAAVAGSAAMLLPQIGVPAMLAACIFLPPMRLRVLASIGVLAAGDLAGSSGAALSYLFTILPEHARAEIPSSVQYGATWMLHAAHASDAAALAGGTASYALMVVAGVLASKAAASQLRDDACFPLVPAAFAMIGGTFVHYAHIMVAIPAALLLATRRNVRFGGAFGAAVLLLVVPWLWALSQPLFTVLFAAVCAACASMLLDWTPRSALRAALASALLCAIVLVTGAHYGAGNPDANLLAHQQSLHSWGRYIASARSGTGPAWWIAKLPTWMGLLLLGFGCAGMLVRPQGQSSAAIGASH